MIVDAAASWNVEAMIAANLRVSIRFVKDLTAASEKCYKHL